MGIHWLVHTESTVYYDMRGYTCSALHPNTDAFSSGSEAREASPLDTTLDRVSIFIRAPSWRPCLLL